jgi:hypothetical protein
MTPGWTSLRKRILAGAFRRLWITGLVALCGAALVNRANPQQTAASSINVDLNGDGAIDSELWFGDCGDGSGRYCVFASSALFTDQHYIAIEHTDARPASVSPDTVNDEDAIRLIGDHTGDGFEEVALLYVRELPDSRFRPAMAIVDVSNESLLGDTTSPPGLSTFMDGYALRADVLFPASPDGHVYPAFTPGYGDSNGSAATRWGWGCLFRLGQTSSDCGPGFIRVSLEPDTLPYGATTWFREAYGHVADIDEDGWEDIHLPYHSAFLSVSGRTGAHLTTTAYDVAASTGAQPLMFHSGRHYGVHHAVHTQESVGSWPIRRTVLVAGSPVGDFDNPMCNVSRYTAVLIQDGQPSTRRLAWADFDGFHSSSWNAWPWVPPGGEAPEPSRWGDFADRCIHRYSDARTFMDGEDVLLVNYFTSDWTHPDNAPLAGKCKNEQYQLYMEPTWTKTKRDVWDACALRHAATKGRWSMKVLRESDGALLTGSADTYVWGWSSSLKPDGEILYLVEILPNPVRFDIKDDRGDRLAPPELHVWSLVNGLWADRGTLPIAGRPVLVDLRKTGALGTGDFFGVKALSLTDLDGDGLEEIAIGTPSDAVVWIGWSSSSGSWITKTGVANPKPPSGPPTSISAKLSPPEIKVCAHP